MTADPARLRALLAEATEGPWEVDDTTDKFEDEMGPDLTTRTGWFRGEVGSVDTGDFSTLTLADATLIVEAVNALPSLLDRLERAEAALRAARFVAEHWRDALMSSLDRFPNNAIGTHPLALVLAAMDGETDPVHLGLNEDAHEAFRALAASEPPAPQEDPK
jgi:hypothetical protein